jgi:hypothetical protein
MLEHESSHDLIHQSLEVDLQNPQHLLVGDHPHQTFRLLLQPVDKPQHPRLVVEQRLATVGAHMQAVVTGGGKVFRNRPIIKAGAVIIEQWMHMHRQLVIAVYDVRGLQGALEFGSYDALKRQIFEMLDSLLVLPFAGLRDVDIPVRIIVAQIESTVIGLTMAQTIEFHWTGADNITHYISIDCRLNPAEMTSNIE